MKSPKSAGERGAWSVRGSAEVEKYGAVRGNRGASGNSLCSAGEHGLVQYGGAQEAESTGQAEQLANARSFIYAQ